MGTDCDEMLSHKISSLAQQQRKISFSVTIFNMIRELDFAPFAEKIKHPNHVEDRCKRS